MIRSNDEFVSGLPLKSFHVSQAIDSHDESVMSRAAPLVKEWAKGPRMSQGKTRGPWCFPYAKSACQVFMWDVDMLGFEEFVDQCRQESFPGDSGTGKTTLGGWHGMTIDFIQDSKLELALENWVTQWFHQFPLSNWTTLRTKNTGTGTKGMGSLRICEVLGLLPVFRQTQVSWCRKTSIELPKHDTWPKGDETSGLETELPHSTVLWNSNLARDNPPLAKVMTGG